MKKFLVILTFPLLIGAGCQSGSGKPAADEPAKPSEFQAVFFNNGQVYYGKLKETGEQFYTLEEVYIINMIPQGENKSPKPRLERFGNEVIGLVNELKINRDQIMFVQNLNTDSKVLEGINRIKSSRGTTLDTGAGEEEVPAQITLPAAQQPKQGPKPAKTEKQQTSAQPADKGQHGVR